MNITCYLLYCTNDWFQQTGEISHFIKALRLRLLRVKLISRVVKESSDSLFPGERRFISLQYSEMVSISLRFHCLSPDMFCRAFSHAKHPRSTRGNFIPILKITRDELPMEQGAYGGCLLCPLYPLLAFYYCHRYLSILALLSIKIIDSLADCRVDSISQGSISRHTYNLDIQTQLPFGCLQTKDGR